jgi:ligand-binding SRPBCC domain-containing protein
VIIEQRSIVRATPDVVWQRITSPAGINYEMKPLMRMSAPRGANLDIAQVQPGQHIGRCWLWLFGFLPFDYDNLTIAALEPGASFHEKSTMLWMRRWEHERFVTEVGEGRTEVFDRVTFTPRLRVFSWPVRGIVRRLFAHRHKRLRRYFAAG